MTTRRFNDPADPPDQPTQRLDAPLDDAIERPCLRCRTPMRLVTVRTPVGSQGTYSGVLILARVQDHKRFVSTDHESACSAWVCPECGSTEFVANDLDALFDPDS